MSDPQGWLPLVDLVAPADEAGVVDAVRDASSRAMPVYPIGGSTAVRCGARPSAPGRGLLLAGLTRVVDHSERDLTITVSASVPLSVISETLGRSGQWLPIDPPLAGRCTIGGAVAVGPSGPRRARHGTLRDYVIGLRAVDGRGVPFKTGGRVVKNVAGYDICKLLTGSLGSLSVITEVTLTVRPRPPARLLAVAPLTSRERVDRLTALLSRFSPLPAAAELLVGPAWRGAAGLPSIEGDDGAWLVVGLEGQPEEVEAALDALRQGSQPEGVCFEALPEQVRDALWRTIVDFPACEGRNLLVQAEALPSKTRDLGRTLVRLDPACSMQVRLVGGSVVARLSLEATAELCRRVRQEIEPLGARMVVRQYPATSPLDRTAVWGPPRPAARVMRAVKDRFDPKGILNPGRFVFEEH